MASDNSVTIVGNLVDDPELRFTRGGQAMARLRLAHSRRWQNRQSGQWEEESHFFTVTAWRDLAENAATTLTKGMRTNSASVFTHPGATVNRERPSPATGNRAFTR